MFIVIATKSNVKTNAEIKTTPVKAILKILPSRFFLIDTNKNILIFYVNYVFKNLHKLAIAKRVKRIFKFK